MESYQESLELDLPWISSIKTMDVTMDKTMAVEMMFDGQWTMKKFNRMRRTKNIKESKPKYWSYQWCVQHTTTPSYDDIS